MIVKSYIKLYKKKLYNDSQSYIKRIKMK